ncbi:MAG: hypothetical protein MUO38_04470 [Anaerolineales bacterium]|nr:hypothetical protein [Anaerolineales bacterium]
MIRWARGAQLLALVLVGLMAAIALLTAVIPVGDALWAEVLGISANVGMATATPAAGREGCSPGFWKQPQHFDSWPARFQPGDSFAAVFLGLDGPAEPTLLQSLEMGGGGLNALMRQSTAALLNAASPAVEFP